MAKRVILIVLGIVLCTLGAISAAGGGVLLALFGPDSTLTSGTHQVTTPTSALVVAMDDIKDTKGFGTAVGEPSLKVTATSTGKPIFLGIAPADAVDRYLAGVPVDKVTDFDVEPFRLDTARQNGNGTTQLTPPQAQTFWAAQSTGTTATVNWKITDGSYRLVLINADATPSVTVDGKFALRIANLFTIGLTLLIAGVAVVVVGIVVLVLGARQPTAPRPTVAAGPDQR